MTTPAYYVTSTRTEPRRSGPSVRTVTISSEPERTNISGEARTDGWCGTTNGVGVYAYGKYDSWTSARAVADDLCREHSARLEVYLPPEQMVDAAAGWNVFDGICQIGSDLPWREAAQMILTARAPLMVDRRREPVDHLRREYDLRREGGVTTLWDRILMANRREPYWSEWVASPLTSAAENPADAEREILIAALTGAPLGLRGEGGDMRAGLCAEVARWRPARAPAAAAE